MRDRRLLLAVAAAAIAVAAWFSMGPADRKRGGRAGESRITGGCSRSEVGGDEGAAAPKRRPPEKTVRDRKLRSETRELLREQMGASYPTAKPRAPARPKPSSAPVAEAPPQPESTGRIDPKYIQQRVREDFFPLARQCYEEILQRRPGIGGKVALHFTIVGDARIGGIVEETSVGDESTLRDEEFDTCMTESMSSMTFPPPEGGGSVTVVYPIEFSSGDDDEGDAGSPAARDGGQRR